MHLGAQTLNVTHYTGNEQLLNSGISSIAFEDKSNQLWTSTRQQGIYSYKNNEFKNYSLNHLTPNIYGYRVLNDEKGKLWIINPNSGLQVGQIVNGKINMDTVHQLKLGIQLIAERFFFNIFYVNDTPHLFSVNANTIGISNIYSGAFKAIEVDENINFHFALVHQKSLFLASNNGLYCIDSSLVIKHIYKQKIESVGKSIKENKLWLISSKQLMLFDYKSNKIEETIPLPQQYNQFSSQIKTCLFEQQLIFYNNTMVVIFNTITHTFTTLSKKNGLLSDGARTISIDRENNIWIGHHSGLSKINHLFFRSFTHQQFNLLEEEISVIKRLKNGNFLIGGNNAFAITDRQLKPLKTYNISNIENKINNRVLDACEIENTIYLSYFNGLAILKNRKLKVLENLKCCLATHQFKNQLIFSNNSQIFVVDKNQKLTLINTPTNITNIRKIFSKNDSTIILCASNGAIEINISKTISTKEILNKSSYAYCTNKLKTISYYGTNEGLFAANKNGIKPLPISNEKNIQVYALQTDCNDNLWIGTNKGIYRYTENNNTFVKVNHLFNVNGIEVNRSAMCIDSQYAYIGTNAGLNKIPINFNLSNYVPNVSITKLSPVELTTNNIYNYKQNTFTFSYCLNSYINEKENRYAYKLIGYDTGWSKENAQSEVRYTNLPPGNYNFKVKAWNVFGNQTKTSEYSFTIKPPFWQTIWFYLIALVLFVLLLWLLYKWRFKALKEKYKRILKLKNSELKVLKAQINPHLISNIMGSIQNHINQNRMDKAGELTSKYSKFVRYSIQYTGLEYISLDDELNYLYDYANIETQTFTDNFTLEIDTTNITNLNKIIIPTMILQPIVENSIKHGLEPKKMEQCTLNITLAQHGKDILCTIQDNGIGRRYAQNKPISYGTSITKNRLRIYKELLESKFLFEVEDLKDSNNIPLGTITTLIIPVKK